MPFLSGNTAVGVNKVNLRVVSRGDREITSSGNSYCDVGGKPECGRSPCFVPCPDPSPPGDERARLHWPPRTLRPPRGFGAAPCSARVSTEAGRGTHCGGAVLGGAQPGPFRWLRGAAGRVGRPGAREVRGVRRKTRTENSSPADPGYCYGRRGFGRGERFCLASWREALFLRSGQKRDNVYRVDAGCIWAWLFGVQPCLARAPLSPISPKSSLNFIA